jgi:Condensation domain
MREVPDGLDELDVRKVAVAFEGAGSGEQQLTWAQNDVWQGMVTTGEAATVSGVHELPPTTTVEELADLLRFIQSRHQALRTRLRLDADGTPHQVCSASGQNWLTVVEAGDAEPALVAEEMRRRLEQQPFDYRNDWPVRMAVITCHAVVSHVVTVYLHLMIDAGGIAAVIADVEARDRQTGAPAGPITALQPLEQARQQAGPAALRQSAASLKNLEHVLRAVRPRLLGEPKATGQVSEYRKIRFVSPATALALPRIAAEQNVTSSAALSAIFAVGLARYLQHGTVWAMVLVNNRFRPGLADSVSQLVQSSPFLIDVAEVSLATAVARARGSLLRTYKYAYYDGRQVDEVVQRVSRERGRPVEFSCYYNDRGQEPAQLRDAPPATDDQLREALAASAWSELSEHALPAVPMFFNADQLPDATDFQVSFDTRYLDVDNVLAILRAIEAAAVQTAVTPDAPTGVLPATI